MRRLSLVLLLAAAPAFAHEVDEGQATPAAKPQAWWLIAPAEAAAHVKIDSQSGYRYIAADGIPDHATGAFPNPGNPNRIRAQDYRYRVTLAPVKRPFPWFYPGAFVFGVAVNGVPFDPATAEAWRNNPASGWNIEAFGPGVRLGLDQNNAHVQPNGAYHYHAAPTGLVSRAAVAKPRLVGWAADGFPIYLNYGGFKSGWRLKRGARPAEPYGPGGLYDGLYTQDYEFKPDPGDLDICNGRFAATPEFPKGTYHYVLTSQFPLVPRCFMGRPDDSFFKGRPRSL